MWVKNVFACSIDCDRGPKTESVLDSRGHVWGFQHKPHVSFQAGGFYAYKLNMLCCWLLLVVCMCVSQRSEVRPNLPRGVSGATTAVAATVVVIPYACPTCAPRYILVYVSPSLLKSHSHSPWAVESTPTTTPGTKKSALYPWANEQFRLHACRRLAGQAPANTATWYSRSTGTPR